MLPKSTLKNDTENTVMFLIFHLNLQDYTEKIQFCLLIVTYPCLYIYLKVYFASNWAQKSDILWEKKKLQIFSTGNLQTLGIMDNNIKLMKCLTATPGLSASLSFFSYICSVHRQH